MHQTAVTSTNYLQLAMETFGSLAKKFSKFVTQVKSIIERSPIECKDSLKLNREEEAGT